MKRGTFKRGSFDARDGHYYVRVRINGKPTYVGHSKDEDEAKKIYDKARAENPDRRTKKKIPIIVVLEIPELPKGV